MIVTRMAGDLAALSRAVLARRGVPAADAAVVADVLVEGNLCGHDSHGVDRLPRICHGLDRGAIRPVATLEVARRTGPLTLLDGHQSLGPVAACDAAARVTEQAREFGVGVVSMRNASHIGMLGYYVRRLAESGLVGVVLTNTEPAMAAFGGAEPVLGSNPLAFGFPGPVSPVVVDLSTTVAARGKLLVAMNRGEPVPGDWAVDADGEATTDPAAALAGALRGIGGAKGYCLAVAVDLLTGGLAGSGVGREVAGTFTMTERATKSDFFLAVDPVALSGRDAFDDAVGRLTADVKSTRRQADVAEILLPGEREERTRDHRLSSGIPVDSGLLAELDRLAAD